MQTLKEKSLEKSFAVLEDFIEARPAKNFGPALKEKKRQAETALAHVRRCLSDDEEEGEGCHAGRPSQNPSLH